MKISLLTEVDFPQGNAQRPKIYLKRPSILCSGEVMIKEKVNDLTNIIKENIICHR